MRLSFIHIVFLCFLMLSQHLAAKADSSKTISISDSVALGKELFHSKYLASDSSISCVDCHYKHQIDTFYWYASLEDISVLYKDKSVDDLFDIFDLPMTDMLFEAHDPYLLSKDTFALIKAYMDDFSDKGLIVSKKTNPQKTWAIILSIVFLFLIIDFLFIHTIKIRFFHAGLGTVILIILFSMAYPHITSMGLQQLYEPDQPIKFSHMTHAGQNKIECLYCHMPAKYGKSAGIPGLSICMNCHSAVTDGSNSGAFEINKVLAAYQEKQSIEWIRIHNLPDHVYFNHKDHYITGKIDCTECHGEVVEIHRIRQVEELSMKWCLDCHEEQKVQILDNDYYEELRNYFKDKGIVVPDSMTVKELGGWECMKCHY
jgi:hypothetical protein